MNDTPTYRSDLTDSLARVGLLLAGGRQEQDEAIALLDKNLRGLIVARIRRAAPSLSSTDLAEAYQGTLLSVWRAARTGSIEAGRSILPLLFTIAQRRATDVLRRAIRRTRDYDAIFDAVADRLADTHVGEAWQRAASREDGRRLMHLIRDTIARLPERQRQVASVVINLFPDVPSLEDMHRSVQAATGGEWTEVAVKRAWQEARKKLRERLIREGYMEEWNHDEQEEERS